jgi:UDPglucose 6-dehydrogenase/GDP-mannose 6-dehydrogenase
LQKAKIRAYDPVANCAARKLFPNGDVVFADNLKDATEKAEAIVVLTKWKEFSCLPELLGRRNQSPLIVDGRRMFDKASIDKYEGIGVSGKCACSMGEEI